MSNVSNFWAKVDKGPHAAGCWLWTASLNGSGCGRSYLYSKKGNVAHRIAYELVVGPVPHGLVLDHLCRVRHCVNPAHLEPVTFADNIRRGRSAPGEVTACPQGHPYDSLNTYIDPRGSRGCRECRRVSRTAHARRVREAAA